MMNLALIKWNLIIILGYFPGITKEKWKKGRVEGVDRNFHSSKLPSFQIKT